MDWVISKKQKKQIAEGKKPGQTTGADIKVTEGDIDKYIVVRHVCTG